jgi:hypothetical protein
VFDSVSIVATLITKKINKKEQGVPMEESKKYLRESNIPSGEEIANMVGCGEVYQRAKKHMMRRQPTMENVVRLTEKELTTMIKETVTRILKENSQETKIKKFRTKSGAPVEVVINLYDDGEGDFEYSIDGGDIDYVSGYLRVEDNEVVDFDGCYDLPKAVKLTLKEMGISCDW